MRTPVILDVIRDRNFLYRELPDGAIETTSRAIAPHVTSRASVLHCAGARGVDELSACKARGAATGVMHPFVSFPSKRSHPSLAGTTFTVSGDRRAIVSARRIARACGARVLVAETGDPAYHAAAALAANDTTVEFTMAATPIPLHPGALRFFEEINAEIPDRLRE